ncbi:MAG: PLP-dependent aminotransferase family protein [Acidobacteria bacterium]|nr:PLP-dependent aminotransferase family protein [Acidobacteriota bacterium]MBI3488880.1 PLP-dependent aminotransferase family protein [Acidobacteriota bacterium]
MRPKELPIAIDPDSPVPMAHQIVTGLIRAIQGGALPPRAALPGTRVLADSLRVSRNTVLTAYAELSSKGWIAATHGSGSFVADLLPWVARPANASRPEPERSGPPAFDLPARPDLATDQLTRVCKLSLGLPDPRLMPVDELGRAYLRALRRRSRDVLEYGGPFGNRELRAALSSFLGERRGMAVPPDSILITRGNQMSLNLVAQGLIKPGDRAAVEQPGSPQACEILRHAGARLVGIPVDEQGLDAAALAAVLQEGPIRLLYLTPRFQIPTTAQLSAERREHILRLAQEHRFGIIEDDSEAEYGFEERFVPPLAAGPGSASVIYLFSFSRLLAPGIRLGLVSASPDAVDRMARIRRRADMQGDLALERAMAELVADGEIHRHIHRVRRVYQERRDFLIRQMELRFGSRFSLTVPTGGLSLWVRTDPSFDLPAWCERCAGARLQLQPGRDFMLDRSPRPAFRLGFGSYEPAEMEDILRRMEKALPD